MVSEVSWPSESEGAAGAAAVTSAVRVRDVVRDTVAELATEELPIVAALLRLDDETVVRRLGGRTQRREPLGFGLGEVAVLVTPVVWLALDQAAQKVAEAAVDGAAKGTKTLLRKVFRRKAAVVVVPPLSPDQLAQVRQLVLELAAQRGLEERRASEIANAVVARLVLDVPESPGRLTAAGSDDTAGAQR